MVDIVYKTCYHINVVNKSEVNDMTDVVTRTTYRYVWQFNDKDIYNIYLYDDKGNTYLTSSKGYLERCTINEDSSLNYPYDKDRVEGLALDKIAVRRKINLTNKEHFVIINKKDYGESNYDLYLYMGADDIKITKRDTTAWKDTSYDDGRTIQHYKFNLYDVEANTANGYRSKFLIYTLISVDSEVTDFGVKCQDVEDKLKALDIRYEEYDLRKLLKVADIVFK